jgi:hypothetical protein
MQQDSSRSDEAEISSCFQAAIKKLDTVDADAKKEKTQIVQDPFQNTQYPQYILFSLSH